MNPADPTVLVVSTPASRVADDLPHPEYPLAIRVHGAANSGTAELPRAAVAALRRAGAGELLFASPTACSLNVYARSEVAANAVLETLKTEFGERVALIGPDVRYWPGPPALEPVMAVEARMPLLFGAFVRREILRRGGQVRSARPERQIVAIRADVPLARLLGFQRWLDSLTDGRANVSIALSRYAPLARVGESAPGPRAVSHA